MAINTIQNFVQGFSSCSWFAERSLRRKKKEYHRQSNNELQERMRGMGCLFFYFVFDGVSLFGSKVDVDIELPRLGGWVIVFRSYPLHEILLHANML